MANTENIEAKLCAYIDGDLDAAGRAEIEKHLANNPQHRALIEQLSGQRDLLRDLPRENAPEEIIEALQGRMERSVLLGDADAGNAEAMKISRWPHVMAVAAIVLLTVGLGTVIYFVLPRNAGKDESYAVITAPGAGMDVAATLPRSDGARFDRDATLDKSVALDAPPADRAIEPMAGGSARSAATGHRAAELSLEAAPASPDPAMKDDVFAKSPPPVPAGEVALDDVYAMQDQIKNADLAKQLKDTPGGLKETAMFVVVSTADSAAARTQIRSYLLANKISWDAVAQPMPQPIDVLESQTVNMSRQQRADVRLKSGPTTQDGAPTSEPPTEFEAKSSAGGGRRAGERPRVEPETATPIPAQPGSVLADASTQPLAPVSRQQEGPVQGSQHPTAGKDLIIARGMTKRQAEELRGSLSKQTTVQRAAVYEQRVARAPSALALAQDRAKLETTPSAATTSPLPGIAQEADAAPLTTLAQTAPPPTSAPSVAVPSPARESESDTPTTQPLTGVPTTAPAFQETKEMDGGLQRGVELGIDPTSPASTAPADEQVDVVILVEDDLPVAPAFQFEPTAPPVTTAPTPRPTSHLQRSRPSKSETATPPNRLRSVA